MSSVQPDLNVWTNEEELALVNSRGFHGSWPQTKILDFWEGAACFVHKCCPSQNLTTSEKI